MPDSRSLKASRGKVGLESDPGTYALILLSRSRRLLRIGRWGLLDLVPGYYIYVGSAFGPGGIRARVGRHYRKLGKRRHWHIDYLREAASFVRAWLSYEPLNREHEWARALAATPGLVPIDRFGCSDCGCRAHLFFSDTMPGPASIEQELLSWPA